MEQLKIEIEIVGPDREILKAFDDAFDAADGHITGRRRGLLEFLPDIQHLIGYVPGAGAGAATLKGLKDVTVAWIKAREGRKVSFKFGGKKVDVHGPAAFSEATKLLEQMAKLPAQQTKPKAKADTRKTRKPASPAKAKSGPAVSKKSQTRKKPAAKSR